MHGFSSRVALAAILIALGGCGSRVPPAASPAAASPPRESLLKLAERYWDERIEVEGLIDPQRLADARSIEKRYLDEVAGAGNTGLDPAAKLNLDIFRRQRELAVEGFTYPSELMPLDPFSAPPFLLPDLAQDAAQHSGSLAEAQAFIKRIERATIWAQQAVGNLKEGLRRGYVTPRIVVLGTVKQLQALLDGPPLKADWQGLPENERAEQAKKGEEAETKLRQSLRALATYLSEQYLPRSRDSVSLLQMPLGAQWYAYRARRATDSSASALELNRQGAAEVERLKARLQALPPATPGSSAAPSELLAAYAQSSEEAAMKLSLQYPDLKILPLDLLLSGTDHAPGSPMAYLPPTLPKGPGMLLVLPKGQAMGRSIAAFVEFALPGRHFQQSWQMADSLPRFRRFANAPAYREGWGVYALALGEQMGLIADDNARRQALMLQLRCAVAVVSDTGIHALGWTSARALDYLHAELESDEAEAQALVENFVAAPADALACTMGELRFQSLRAHAQQVLGARFDEHDFHVELLRDGAMPMDILEGKMKVWLESKR